MESLPISDRSGRSIPGGGERRKPSRRTRILTDAGMTHAPEAVQRAFWQSYNLRRRSRTERCDTLLEKLPVWQGAGSPLGTIQAAWRAVLPACYAGFAEAEWFRGGRLRVRVDSAGTQFVLSRLTATTLLAALNDRIRPLRVKQVDFRVGRRADFQTGRQRLGEGKA